MRESSMERSQVWKSRAGLQKQKSLTLTKEPERKMGSLRGSVISGYSFLPDSHLYKDVTYICMHMHSMCMKGCMYYAMHLKVAFASASSRTSFNVTPVVTHVQTITTTQPRSLLPILKRVLFLSSSRSLAKSLLLTRSAIILWKRQPSLFPAARRATVRRPTDVRPRRPRPPSNQELLTRGITWTFLVKTQRCAICDVQGSISRTIIK